MAPPYAILFDLDNLDLDNLEKRILENTTLKPYVWWRYIDDVFLIWKHGEEALKLL